MKASALRLEPPIQVTLGASCTHTHVHAWQDEMDENVEVDSNGKRAKTAKQLAEEEAQRRAERGGPTTAAIQQVVRGAVGWERGCVGVKIGMSYASKMAACFA
eukprot:1160151-Pelagomonas_calceolata.AAC.4